MPFEWNNEEREFLDARTWAVLATGRQDGSPQQSMIGYALDTEGRLLVSVKAYTAKWNNARRQPRVSLTIADGREHLVIYGLAEAIDIDPVRAELTAQVFAASAVKIRPPVRTRSAAVSLGMAARMTGRMPGGSAVARRAPGSSGDVMQGGPS